MGNIVGCVVTRMYLTRVPEQCLLEVPTLRREQNSAHKVTSVVTISNIITIVCGNQKRSIVVRP